MLNRSAAPKSSPTVIEHDFGSILARGQLLSHVFTLRNPSDRALVLGKPELTTPCCSAVESAPTSIPARGSVRLPIVFRPGFQSGAKRVGFIIPTDSATLPGFDLRVGATLFGEVEIRPLATAAATVQANQGGTTRFRVISRSRGTIGRPAPDRLATSGSLMACYVGPAGKPTTFGDIIEIGRDVEVALPASDQVGPRRGEVRVLWPDGRDWTYPIAWEVRPLVHATPSGVVLRSGVVRSEHVVVVRSDDRPIRIVGIEGVTLAAPVGPFDPTPRTVQTVRLVLDPHRSQGASDISIRTDHPGQPEVTVSVLTAPVSSEEHR